MERIMRNKISGAIGVIWGGLILLNGLASPAPTGSEAYRNGHTGALVFGGLLVAAGLYYFFKKPKPKA